MNVMSKPSLGPARGFLCLALTLAPAAAHAQHTPDEWAALHARDAYAQRALARGAIPLLRLRSLRPRHRDLEALALQQPTLTQGHRRPLLR